MKRQKTARYPEILIGLILIIAGVAFVFILSGSDNESGEEVAILTSAIQKDEILRQEHLGIVRVSTSSPVVLLSSSAASTLIGQKAIINLPAGTPVLGTYFSTIRNVAPGNVLVGMRLGIGQYPLPHLRTGDLVDIADPTQETEQLLLKGIEVYSVYQLVDTLETDIFITLSIPEFAEQMVAAALTNGDIRLFFSPHPVSLSAAEAA